MHAGPTVHPQRSQRHAQQWDHIHMQPQPRRHQEAFQRQPQVEQFFRQHLQPPSRYHQDPVQHQPQAQQKSRQNLKPQPLQQQEVKPTENQQVPRELPPGATTVVVRNIPWEYTQEELEQEWPLDGTYDYMHLPMRPHLNRNAGYAFINFTEPSHAARFTALWHGQRLRRPYRHALNVKVATLQGKLPNLLKFGLGVLMHEEEGGLSPSAALDGGSFPLVLHGGARVDVRPLLRTLLAMETDSGNMLVDPTEHLPRSAAEEHVEATADDSTCSWRPLMGLTISL